jgi:hypothetical protein
MPIKGFRKTHCIHGHRFNDKSRFFAPQKSGYTIQRCRICASKSSRESHARRRQRIKMGEMSCEG